MTKSDTPTTPAAHRAPSCASTASYLMAAFVGLLYLAVELPRLNGGSGTPIWIALGIVGVCMVRILAGGGRTNG